MSIQADVSHFLRRSGLPKSKFGRMAAKDPNLVDDMMMGRKLGANLSGKVHRFMAEYEI